MECAVQQCAVVKYCVEKTSRESHVKWCAVVCRRVCLVFSRFSLVDNNFYNNVEKVILREGGIEMVYFMYQAYFCIEFFL